MESDTALASTPDRLAEDGAALAAVLAWFSQKGRHASENGDPSGLSMSLPRFKRLAAQMPKIARIVNQFQSPDIQREVLQALVRAFEAEATAEDLSDARNGHAAPGLVVSDTAPAFFDESTAAAMHDDPALLGEEGSSIHH